MYRTLAGVHFFCRKFCFIIFNLGNVERIRYINVYKFILSYSDV